MSFPFNIYNFLIEPIRLQDQKTKFLERYLKGPQEVADITWDKIQDLKQLFDWEIAPDKALRNLLWHVGFTRDLDFIVQELDYDDMRRLLGLAVAMWKSKGLQSGLEGAIRSLVGRDPQIFDWFHLRFEEGKTYFGEEWLGDDPIFLDEIGGTEYDEYRSVVFIEDWSSSKLISDSGFSLTKWTTMSSLSLRQDVSCYPSCPAGLIAETAPGEFTGYAYADDGKPCWRGTGDYSQGAYHNWEWQGDFKAEANVTSLGGAQIVGWVQHISQFFMAKASGESVDPNNMIGLYYLIRTEGSLKRVNTVKIVNGVVTSGNYADISVNPSFKIERTGDSYRLYYDVGSGWVLLQEWFGVVFGNVRPCVSSSCLTDIYGAPCSTITVWDGFQIEGSVYILSSLTNDIFRLCRPLSERFDIFLCHILEQFDAGFDRWSRVEGSGDLALEDGKLIYDFDNSGQFKFNVSEALDWKSYITKCRVKLQYQGSILQSFGVSSYMHPDSGTYDDQILCQYNHEDHIAQIWKRINDAWTVEASTPYYIPPDAWYTWTILIDHQYEGKAAERVVCNWYLDGVLVLSKDWPKADVPNQGTIGFRKVINTKAYIDWIRLQKLPISPISIGPA